jgi:hypothetical protein
MKLARRPFLRLAGAAALSPVLPAAAAGAKSYLSRAQAAKLRAQIAAVPPDIRGEFARPLPGLAQDLGQSRHRGPFGFGIGAKLDEFAALIALGAPILPLLIEKIARPEDFFALQAY